MKSYAYIHIKTPHVNAFFYPSTHVNVLTYESNIMMVIRKNFVMRQDLIINVNLLRENRIGGS